MFLVYGDESLDEKKDRVCAVAGLIGMEHGWQAIERQWKALHGEVPFHANNCDSDKGDFAPKAGETADERHHLNKNLYRKSIELLAANDIGGYAAAYDLAAQRKAFPQPYYQPVYYQPFIDVLEEMYKFADKADDQVEFTFDSRTESEHNAGLIYAQIRESHPSWQKRIADKISFVSSQKNLRIQIADLFAREAMKVLDNKVGPVKREERKSWLALKSTGKFTVVIRSHEHFADAKTQIERLESITGLTSLGYSEWLAKKGRQRNVSTFFQFLGEYMHGLSDEERQTLAKGMNFE